MGAVLAGQFDAPARAVPARFAFRHATIPGCPSSTCINVDQGDIGPAQGQEGYRRRYTALELGDRFSNSKRRHCIGPVPGAGVGIHPARRALQWTSATRRDRPRHLALAMMISCAGCRPPSGSRCLQVPQSRSTACAYLRGDVPLVSDTALFTSRSWFISKPCTRQRSTCETLLGTPPAPPPPVAESRSAHRDVAGDA